MGSEREYRPKFIGGTVGPSSGVFVAGRNGMVEIQPGNGNIAMLTQRAARELAATILAIVEGF